MQIIRKATHTPIRQTQIIYIHRVVQRMSSWEAIMLLLLKLLQR